MTDIVAQGFNLGILKIGKFNLGVLKIEILEIENLTFGY
jgi:hypothetical protein